jgi:hypothetical protein
MRRQPSSCVFVCRSGFPSCCRSLLAHLVPIHIRALGSVADGAGLRTAPHSARSAVSNDELAMAVCSAHAALAGLDVFQAQRRYVSLCKVIATALSHI